MTLKEQMQQAQRLIRTRQYDEARAILETIDHPTAKDWLQKLDEIAPFPEVETAVPQQPEIPAKPDLKAQMQKAQGLIRGEQYDEARAILATIDHPTAKKWLKKLEDATPVPTIEDIPAPENVPDVAELERTATAAYTPPQSTSSSRSRLLPLLLLTLAVVLVGGLIALVLTGTLDIPGLDLAAAPEGTSEVTVAPDIVSVPDATATDVDIAETPDSTATVSIEASATVETSDMTATPLPDNPTAPPETAIPTEIAATPVPIEEATPVVLAQSAGVRIPFIHELALFRVELPEGWQCICDGESGILQSEDDVIVNVALATHGFDPAAYVGVPLEDVAVQELGDDETLVSQTTQMANNRSVLIAVVDTADDTTKQRYYVNDSQGQVVQLTIAGTSDETAAVTGDVLLMASTIDTTTRDEAIEFSTRLFAGAFVYNADLNRWRFPDLRRLRQNEQPVEETVHFQVDVELPPGWMMDSGLLGVPLPASEDNIEASRTMITVLPVDDTETPLEDLLMNEFEQVDNSPTLLTSETVTMNDREVYLATFQDSGVSEDVFETSMMLVQDSDGDILSLSTLNLNPNTEMDETIREDILFMAGNAEAEAIDYVTRLARAGLIEGVDAVDDGYLPAGAGATP